MSIPLTPHIETDFRFGAGSDDVEHYVGAYLRLRIPKEDRYPYIFAGWSALTLATSSDGTENDKSSDFSYGVGADFFIWDEAGVTIEWGVFHDKDGIEISGWRIGFVLRP